MKLRREYDAAARAYDRRWAAYTRRTLALLRPWLTEAEPRALVDVGCGTAELLGAMRGWGLEPERYVGVDPSPGMLGAAAAKLGGGARVVASPAEALPLRDAAFDCAVSASSLHFWPAPDAGLAEVRRVLAPGGRFLLLDWSRDFAGMRVMDAWLRITGRGLVRTYSRTEMGAMLMRAGFDVRRALRARVGGLWAVEVIEAVA